MDQNLFPNETDPQARLDTLESIADLIEQKTYVEPLTSEELNDLRNEFLQKLFLIDREEEKLAEIQLEYKNRLKPIKAEAAEIKHNLRMEVREVEGKIYTIFDHEKGIAGEYNSAGRLLKTRPMLPTEKQLKIKHLRAANE